MASGGEFDRRSFLVGASAPGGGLALGFAIPFAPGSAVTPACAAGAPEITCWVAIAPDDTVTIRVAHAEMGQGALTGLAMLVAEELECDWAKVRTEFVSPTENLLRAQAWGDTSTGASRSIATSQHYLRRAGATAREMLIAAAAARWNVPAAQCTALNGSVTHAPSGRTVTFGAVAEAAAKVAPPTDVKVKPPHAWKLAGTPRRRLDVLDKVTAKPVYAIDVRLPGMLYAAIVQCPVFGGTLKSVDESSIAAMRGVRGVVRMADAVAVVADSWWRAKRAADALRVNWDDGGNNRVSSATIAQVVRDGLDAPASGIGRADGDAAAALARAPRRLAADYAVPFLAHATMEPQTCTAQVRPDGVDIWTPSQDPATALVTAAVAAGVPNEKVTVHRMMLGGGFGRRGPVQEYVRQAVVIAKEFREPVKLVWSREQDIAHDLYRPCGMARLTAGLDAEGMPVAWTIRLAGPSFVAALVPEFGANIVDRSFVSGLTEEMPYDVPNYLVDYVICPRRCRSASGARSTTRRTPFTRNASSTRWRMPPAWTPICIGASCWPRVRKISPCWTPRRGKPTGAARYPRVSIAASRSVRRAAAIARRWSRLRSPTAACACIASSRRSIAATSSIRSRSKCRPKAPSSML